MKASAKFVLALASGTAVEGTESGDDRTITRVVKLLQGMLDKSKADGDEMNHLYAGFKCYCDTNKREKTTSIENLGVEIGQLEAKIEELQAKTGVLSKECQKLKADLAANQQAMDNADALRQKENTAFEEMKADSEQAIGQMNDAIKALFAVGADQTSGAAAADHEMMMAGFKGSLIGLHKAVKEALLSASAFASKTQIKTIDSFLQAPFTGSYTSASAEVIGILKNMRDTFKENLANAVAGEEKAQEGYDKFMKIRQKAQEEMEASYQEKDALMGDDDELLAAKREQKSGAETNKESDEAFLASLLDQCAEKAKQFDERTLLRRQEEAALSEAISILNSDAAFATFGKVSATKSGDTGFLQLVSVHRQSRVEDVRREDVKRFLRKASERHWSPVLSKVVGLLEKGNPFTTVLEEIKKMLALITKEGKADHDQLSWCNEERESNENSLSEKKKQIGSLTSEIDELTMRIGDPEMGLKVQIEETDTSLTENSKAQAFQTKERKETNAAYQEDIGHLLQAEKLLENAISVLAKYYEKISKSELIQTHRDGPAPPKTWEGDYQGQSGKGRDAVGQLEFILKGTKEEEAEARKDEEAAQTEFENTMSELKAEETSLSESLTRLHKELAEAEQTLIEKTQDKKNTVVDKEAIEAYLEKIKPGCDFITAEIDARDENRRAETEALEKATELLKATPAYQSAEAAAHTESLGDCVDICKESEEDAKCKACLAKTSVPGYCAGHPDTPGCN